MPWLTPDEIPEGTACRPLFIPDSTAWLAIVSGALDPLTQYYNWEKFGTLTPEQCAERMNDMLNQYYEDVCNDCTLPFGGRVISLNFDGIFEELVDGEWVAPQGDYALPPVPERTGGTPSEQRCLAAANAENTLHELYEQVTDLFNAHVSAAEAAIELAVLLGLLIAPPLGLLGASVIAIGRIAFGEFFAFMDFITEDVWDADFSTALRCYLYECTLNSGGVVTFDRQCVLTKIGDNTNPFDLSLTQFRLLGQVSYLLNIIGADGLNLAGATTAVTSADCGDCDDTWCFTYDLELSNAGGSGYTVNGCVPSYDSGVGWKAVKGGGCAIANGVAVLAAVNISFASTFIKRVVVIVESSGRAGGSVFAVAFPAINRGGTPAVHGENPLNGVPVGVELTVNNTITGVTIEGQNGAPSAGTQSSGTIIIKQVTFYGTGTCPFGDPNCLP